MTNDNFTKMDRLVMTSGFIGGIFWNVFSSKNNFSDFLDRPLTTIFCSSLNGLFYSYGALFVAQMLPTSVRPIVPISILLSLVYHYEKCIGSTP